MIKLFENFDETEDNPNWEITSAKRKDGQVFNIEDQYKDMNGDVYTIKRMWITKDGRVMAEAEEGGAIDLWSVKK